MKANSHYKIEDFGEIFKNNAKDEVPLLGFCFLPPWGLSSREPQIPKSLRLSVCPQLPRNLPRCFCTGFKRRCHSVYFQRCSKGVPKKSTFKEDWSDFQGTVFFRTFWGFV